MARCWSVQSSLYRLEKKFGKAQTKIDLAQQVKYKILPQATLLRSGLWYFSIRLFMHYFKCDLSLIPVHSVSVKRI